MKHPKEALRLALEALDTAWTYDKDNADGYYFEVITAVKEALAQPVQEGCDCVTRQSAENAIEYMTDANSKGRDIDAQAMLVSAPLPVQEPVACVDIKDGCLVGSHRDGSKPFPDGQYGLWPITSPPRPVQEPVAWEQFYPGLVLTRNPDFLHPPGVLHPNL